MATSRRVHKGRKQTAALSDFITEQLAGLQAFADYLSTEPRASLRHPQWDAATVAHVDRVDETLRWAWETARQVAMLGAGREVLPETVLPLLKALAERTPVSHRFALRVGQRDGVPQWVVTSLDPTRAHVRMPATRSDIALELESPSPSLAGFVHVLAYVQHPHRERLKRCQQCDTWFIDTSRNRSALRCSTACTIAWSNSHRPKKGGS